VAVSAWLVRRSRFFWTAAALLLRLLGNMEPQPDLMIMRHGAELTADMVLPARARDRPGPRHADAARSAADMIAATSAGTRR
jgi:hypothetical protein